MLKLRGKLLAGLAGLLATLIGVCILCSLIVSRYSTRIELLLKEDYQSAEACQSMKESLESLLKLAQRRVWNDQDAFAAASRDKVAAFDQSLKKQMDAVDVEGEAAATDHLAIMWKSFQASFQKLFSPDLDEAQRKDFYLLAILPEAEELRAQAQRIIDMNLEFLNSGREQAKLAAAGAQWKVNLLAAAGTGVAALIVLLCGVLVLRPVRMLTGSVKEIAKGNLDLAVSVRSRDEIGELAQAFNQMTEQLRYFKRLDQDRLIRTQRTTQLAIDALPDAIVVIDLAGTIELTNESAGHLFKLRPGQRVAELELTWLAELHHRAMHEPEPRNETAYKSAIKVDDAGQARHLLPRTYRIRDQNESVIGVAIFLADITDFRRLDEMKNDLLSTVAHELKTPLTSMRMISHLLDEQLGPKLSVRHRDLLSASRADSDRLNHIVEELLDIGRLESGRAALNLKLIAIDELIHRCIDPMRQAIQSHGLGLEVVVEDDIPGLNVDADRMCRVFANLLANCIKYTSSGGAVSIKVRRQDSMVDISVGDTGAGIPSRYQSRIFEKFFRVPGQPGDSGTGLGLSIVKEIIEAHGGGVEVQSSEGQGTTIFFTLPLPETVGRRALYANS